jgi:hypothetical protein
MTSTTYNFRAIKYELICAVRKCKDFFFIGNVDFHKCPTLSF